jgi:hypothetical protein
MSDRDPYTTPDDQSAFPDASDPSAPVRNRPAAGAPQLETTSEIDLDWQGNTGATDFLGLDGDLRMDPSGGGAASPIDGFAGRAAGEGPVLDSWLMEIESHTGAPAPSAESAEGASRVLDGIDGADTETDTDPSTPPPPARQKRVLQVVVLAAVLLLAAGGAWYWQQRQAHLTDSTQVATRPAPKNTPKPKIPTPKTPKDPNATTTPAVADPSADPSDPSADPTPSATDPLEPGNDTLAADPGNVTDPTSTTDPLATAPIERPVVDVTPPTHVTTSPANPDVDPKLDPSVDLTLPTLTLPTLPANPVAPTTAQPVHRPVGTLNPRGALHVKVDPSGKIMPGSVRRATEADFADLWREKRIPTELFNSERRIRTLAVGPVKALVVGGEYFEGTLYAVGQGQIWIDVELGRISLEASTVRELTQVATVKAAGPNKGGKAEELAALPHVEVRLPGGSVTGRLVGQDGNRVTIVTEHGMRATVDSDDVRPLTNRNTRVVGSLKDIEKKRN